MSRWHNDNKREGGSQSTGRRGDAMNITLLHNGTCSYQTKLSLSLFNLRKLANNQYLILHKQSVRAKLDGKLDVIRVRIKMQKQFSFKCDQKPTGPSHCYFLNILNFFQILCNISEHL